MALAFIGLGSNLGDGRKNLLAAWDLLKRQQGLMVLALSSPYLTQPVVKPEWRRTGRQLGGQLFTNAVGVVEAQLKPLELLQVLRKVEDALGRNRSRTVDRVIDLDLLCYDDQIMNEPELVLPHPELVKRMFVLAPLDELAPEHLHPVLGLTTRQLRLRLPAGAEAEVKRSSWDQD